MIQTHMTAIPTTAQAQNVKVTLTSHPFTITTDMMRPVLYLIDPISDTLITVDLSTDPKYPTGSMPLHTLITPDGEKAFLSTMSSDTAPATILALDINNIDWQAGKADVAITNVIKIAEPNTKPPNPPVQNGTDDDTQPIIASLWFPQNVQIHGPSLDPTCKFAYFTEWTNNGKIRVLDVNKGTLAESDPIQYGDTTAWLHGVYFNPSGDKALSPKYHFEGNYLVLWDVDKETGQLSNPVKVILGSESQYAAFPHFVTWIDDTTAITSTQQLGPTSLTPDNAEIIGPSVWLINTNKIGDDKSYDSDSYDSYSDYSPRYNQDPRDDKSYDSDSYDSYSDYSPRYNQDPRDDKSYDSDSYDSYSDYSPRYNQDPRDDKSYDSDSYDSYSDYSPRYNQDPIQKNPREAAATMIIAPTQSPDGNGIYKPASDTKIVNSKLYVGEEDSMDEEINNDGHVSIWDISDITNPQLINRLSPGKGLPENFEIGHTIYATPDNKFVYVESWHSAHLVKIDTAIDQVIQVFNKENAGFEHPHGGFITGDFL